MFLSCDTPSTPDQVLSGKVTLDTAEIKVILNCAHSETNHLIVFQSTIGELKGEIQKFNCTPSTGNLMLIHTVNQMLRTMETVEQLLQ